MYLEHVLDDQRALSECSRVLKSMGIAVFTIPGDFHKFSTWHYDEPDQNGHYRHYGMDVLTKMRKVFQDVTAIDMGKSTEQRLGIRKGDYVFICVK